MKTTIKLIIFCVTFSGIQFAQNITNTLGTSGIFYIKNSSTNYFTLTQSTGQVSILNTLRMEPTTSSTVGVIYNGSNRFLHNFGSSNTFLGVSSGNFSLTNGNNTGCGYQTLTSLTTGYQNTAIGSSTLRSVTSGLYNTGCGTEVMFNSTGDKNSGFGAQVMYFNTTGNNNCALGYQSLYDNTTGSSNSGFGLATLQDNTTGNNNSAFGYFSLANCTGDNNSAIGNQSGYNLTTGDNNAIIGYNAQPSSATVSNQITLGNGSITSLRCNVTSISSLSDARDKKNITDLSLGLDFLMKLKPRQFNWDKREWYENNTSDSSKMQETKTAGFIAQELDETQSTQNAEWLNLVLKDNPEKIEATYGNLLPVIVKAIQELKEQNEKLNQKVEHLEEIIENYSQLVNNK